MTWSSFTSPHPRPWATPFARREPLSVSTCPEGASQHVTLKFNPRELSFVNLEGGPLYHGRRIQGLLGNGPQQTPDADAVATLTIEGTQKLPE